MSNSEAGHDVSVLSERLGSCATIESMNFVPCDEKGCGGKGWRISHDQLTMCTPMNESKNAVVAPVEPIVSQSTMAAFSEALNGGRGDLDAWLEVNNESEVRAHVLAMVSAERERCAKLCEQHAAEAWDHEGGALACAERIRGA